MKEGRAVPWAFEKIQRCPCASIWRVGLSWASSVFLSRRIAGLGTVLVTWSKYETMCRIEGFLGFSPP
jgi:hypothetical protein